MNTEPNPYAPPRADADAPRLAEGSGSGGLQREGNLLVIPPVGAWFPPRCVICNQPAQRRLGRKLYWHPQGYYALIFIGVLIYAIAAMIVRKSAQFEVAVCDAHMARRRNGILIGWLGAPICLIAGVVLADTSPWLMLVLFVLALGAMVTGIMLARIVSPARITREFAWIRVGQPFLDSI